MAIVFVGEQSDAVALASGFTPIPSTGQVLGPDGANAEPMVEPRYRPHYGDGIIAGIVTVDGIPSYRRVRLFDKLTARILAETFSDPINGYYEFKNWDRVYMTYFVVAHDYQKVFNAVIADNITPDAIP